MIYRSPPLSSFLIIGIKRRERFSVRPSRIVHEQQIPIDDKYRSNVINNEKKLVVKLFYL